MKLTVIRKQPAPRDSHRYIDKYLNEMIEYGGCACTRHEAILDMQQIGLTQPEIDRWLQGQELAQRLRESNRRFRLYVESDPKLLKR
jgi:hypothetical protein